MNYQVSDESLKATTQCETKFSCLTGDRKNMCAVEDCVNKEVYFIKYPNNGRCAYKCTFGENHFCTCPIRKELFNKFSV